MYVVSPLGLEVLSSYRSLTVEETDRLHFISQYDFQDVKARVLEEGQVSPEEVDEAVVEFRKFVTLIALGYRPLAMASSAVDEIWHTFILYTRKYSIFCDRAVGGFIHHEPASGEQPVSDESKQMLVSAYIEVFGEFSPIWVINAECHKCDTPCKGDPGTCDIPCKGDG